MQHAVQGWQGAFHSVMTETKQLTINGRVDVSYLVGFLDKHWGKSDGTSSDATLTDYSWDHPRFLSARVFSQPLSFPAPSVDSPQLSRTVLLLNGIRWISLFTNGYSWCIVVRIKGLFGPRKKRPWYPPKSETVSIASVFLRMLIWGSIFRIAPCALRYATKYQIGIAFWCNHWYWDDMLLT